MQFKNGAMFLMAKSNNPCDVTATKTGVKVSFNDLTLGQTLALVNALKSYRENSVVAKDVSCFLENAIIRSPHSNHIRELLV